MRQFISTVALAAVLGVSAASAQVSPNRAKYRMWNLPIIATLYRFIRL